MPNTAPTPEEIRKNQIKLAIETMAAAGITSVIVSFDGCGDSGQITEVEINPEGQTLPDTKLTWTSYSLELDCAGRSPENWAWNDRFTPKEGQLYDLIESVVYDLLEAKHPGWEINEGSFGRFTFNCGPALKNVEVEFNQRIESYNTETYTAE